MGALNGNHCASFESFGACKSWLKFIRKHANSSAVTFWY